MISVSETYINQLNSLIREQGEITVVWTMDNDTITLSDDELSAEYPLIYESYMHPYMLELPYKKMSFSFIDEDGEYDPQNTSSSNITTVTAKQPVVLKYKQYYSDGTYDEFIIDTLYTTGEISVSNKIVTVYCQDILSFDETGEYVVDNDDDYSKGVLLSKTYYDLFDLVLAKIEDIHDVTYTISDATTLNNTSSTVVFAKDQTPVQILQALTNSIGYVYTTNGSAVTVKSNETTTLHPYELTLDEMLEFPLATSSEALRSMTVYFYTYAITGTEASTTSSFTLSSSSGNYYHVNGTVSGTDAFLYGYLAYNGSKCDCVSVSMQQTDPYSCTVDAIIYMTFDDGNSFDVDNVSVVGHAIQKLQNSANYPVSLGDYGEDKSLDNVLVTSSTRALALAQEFYNESLAKNALTVNYRGEPSLEVGDTIIGDTEYESGVSFRVIKQSLLWNGALSGTLELLRVEDD